MGSASATNRCRTSYDTAVLAECRCFVITTAEWLSVVIPRRAVAARHDGQATRRVPAFNFSSLFGHSVRNRGSWLGCVVLPSPCTAECSSFSRRAAAALYDVAGA